MRDEMRNALQGFRAGFRHANWYGKTRRQFWAWFGEQEAALLARAADEAERAELEAELLESRAMADDYGYAAPPELDDVPIDAPAALVDLAELEARVAALRSHMPEILAMDEADQMEAFAGVADQILEDAGEHRELIWSELQCILRDAGLIPGDDEPCDAS
ncbi:MAG TPA: hypothetical protein VIG97_03560 [Luteimonas sp.]